MNLTDKEKEAVRLILEQHLEEIKSNEKILNQNVQLLAMEVKYEDMLKDIIKKLK
ncbi:hypothetical protein J4414_01785 [Candidatus Woesearchaeota archaeon]|nr:hypothetical protein [Candidatus Woesearchaeota archaeon]